MRNLIGKFGIRIAEGGTPDGRPLRACPSPFPLRSAFRIPHSAFPIGITLIEVLISMGVLTLGILGVAALFPVGSYYAQRGDIHDRADAAAAAALNDGVTRGMVNPERWVTIPQTPLTGNFFTKPFTKPYRNRMASFASGGMTAQEQGLLIQDFGSIYFIDPVGAARGTDFDAGSGTLYAADPRLGAAPASINGGNMFRPSSGGTAGQLWSPWSGRRPILRVALDRNQQATSPARPLSVAGAEKLASIADDLVFDLGDQPDQPSRQQWLTSNNGVPIGRMARSNFDYLISVVPRTPEAWHALAHGGRGEAYDVAAVVFNRRPANRFDRSAPLGGIETTMRAERMANVSILSTGTAGGEVRLLHNPTRSPDSLPPEDVPWKDLKAGQYVFLFGPAPNTMPQRPMLFGQWYRVVAIDNEEETSMPGAFYVGPTLALRGPDWPWNASSLSGAMNRYLNPTAIEDDLRMLIFDGVVAVHTRTMRLDAGTAWE